MSTVDEIVAETGEHTRGLVAHSLAWLDKEEPKWGLESPINRLEYVKGLLERAVLPPCTGCGCGE
jgi:hypothetical protein